MNWEAVGAIGEVVGAIGVILTLGYLAAQIRQNSRVVRSATRQAISTAQAEVGFRLAENPELRSAMAPFSALGSLPDAELRRSLFFRGLLRIYENQYHQYVDGTFDERMWSGYLHNMSQSFASASAREFWGANRALYSSDFAAFIDQSFFAAGGGGDAA